MATPFLFRFRNHARKGLAYIDTSDPPCFIFVELLDKELISEFGEDVTIVTDFERRLPKKDDYPALISLRQAVFDGLATTPEFLTAKVRSALPEQALKNSS